MIALAAAIAFQCTAVLYAQDAFRGWTVDARTKSLELLAVDESAGKTTFVLKNVSGRVISAYSACFSRGQGFTSCHDSDWSDADTEALADGDMDRLVIGSAEASEYKNHILQISAVLFEDGTSEGLPYNISFIELKRLGRALETRRTSDVLSSFNGRTLGDLEIERLADRIGTEPKQPDQQFVNEVKGMSVPGLAMPDFQNLSERLLGSLFVGVTNARFDMLRAIDDLRKLPVSSADPNVLARTVYLSGLQHDLDERSSRMIDTCKRSQRAKSK